MPDSEMGLPFIKQGCTDVNAGYIMENNKGGKFHTPLFASVELNWSRKSLLKKTQKYFSRKLRKLNA